MIFKSGASRANVSFDDIRALVAPDAPFAVEATQTVGDLGQAARALRDLADYLERNPNAVVFGRAQNGR